VKSLLTAGVLLDVAAPGALVSVTLALPSRARILRVTAVARGMSGPEPTAVVTVTTGSYQLTAGACPALVLDPARQVPDPVGGVEGGAVGGAGVVQITGTAALPTTIAVGVEYFDPDQP